MNVFIARLRRVCAGAPRSDSSAPWRLPVAAASLALLLAACGGADEKAAETNPARSSAAAAPTEARNASTDAKIAGARPPRSYERIGITALAASADGIASASADGRVSVLDATTLGESRVLKQTPGVIAGLIFSGGGRYLIGVGRNSVAQVWDVQTGEQRYQLHGHEHPLRCVAASDDGSVVATCGEDTRVLLWDGATGKLRRVLSGHGAFVNAASVTADGRLLATGGADARVLLWDAAAGQLRRTLLGHADELAALAFSGDGRWLASAGLDGKVLL
jgi:WD40 repeat protein